ncbi:type III-B CRISPR-associated protein Cas10/Cmr2 [Persephonella sp. KM09-Lau-8]|uniref:type III-B CRISPR-associated protein Cas10/Cmr2 n=1 Tax=Persephonella sp. KM09-Lau-8 TaxID=1158345 RepID=UPI000496C1B3|nr:type III-B CRISPR-associated protein Cas10/Cmr2 [Persephonella sp. KM09-Lau-8]
MSIKTKYLFQITIPSVQKLITASRKSHDLWAGSFLISYLLKEAVKPLKDKENIEFIFPHEDLLEKEEDEIANVPNKILFTIEASKDEIKELGQNLEKSIKSKLKNLIKAEFIEEKLPEMKCGSKELMEYQLENFVNVIWGAVPLEENNYIASLDKLDKYIAYKKSSTLPNRRFIESYKLIDLEEENPFVEGLSFEQIYKYFIDEEVKEPHFVKGAYRCTLCGDRIILEATGNDYKGNCFWEDLWKKEEKLFTKGERLCGVCLAKRTFKFGGFPSVSEIATTTFKIFLKDYPKAVREIINVIKSAENEKKYFSEIPQTVPKLQEESQLKELLKIDGEYLIPQVWETDEERPDIARRLTDIYKKLNKFPSDSFAILLMDGDSMGAKLRLLEDIKEQKDLSKKLSEFTTEVKKIVENENYGKLIYAGGDDVLALLPIEFALKCAYEIQEKFRKKLTEIEEKVQNKLPNEKKDKTEYKFTMSGGLLFAYHKLPLNYVLNKVREFEQKAKNSGKNRVYFGYIKHSLAYTETSISWNEYKAFKEILNKSNQIPNTFITQSYELFRELENTNSEMNEKLFKSLLKRKVGEEKSNEIIETFKRLDNQFKDPLRLINILKIAKYINKR